MAECEGINMGFEYMVCGLQWHTFAESSEAAEVERVRPKRYSVYYSRLPDGDFRIYIP